MTKLQLVEQLYQDIILEKKLLGANQSLESCDFNTPQHRITV
jgi:hypothetical protein